MSNTVLKAIWPGQTTNSLVELVDSSACAPAAWAAMRGKYLFRREWASDKEHLKAIWAIGVLPRHHRAVLAMTSDHAMVLQKDYRQAAADIRAWLRDFGNPAGHWKAIASVFDSAPDYPALGFHLTSTFQDPWAPDVIDWSRPWSVYDVLDKHYPNDTGHKPLRG